MIRNGRVVAKQTELVTSAIARPSTAICRGSVQVPDGVDLTAPAFEGESHAERGRVHDIDQMSDAAAAGRLLLDTCCDHLPVQTGELFAKDCDGRRSMSLLIKKGQFISPMDPLWADRNSRQEGQRLPASCSCPIPNAMGQTRARGALRFGIAPFDCGHRADRPVRYQNLCTATRPIVSSLRLTRKLAIPIVTRDRLDPRLCRGRPRRCDRVLTLAFGSRPYLRRRRCRSIFTDDIRTLVRAAYAPWVPITGARVSDPDRIADLRRRRWNVDVIDLHHRNRRLLSPR